MKYTEQQIRESFNNAFKSFSEIRKDDTVLVVTKYPRVMLPFNAEIIEAKFKDLLEFLVVSVFCLSILWLVSYAFSLSTYLTSYYIFVGCFIVGFVFIGQEMYYHVLYFLKYRNKHVVVFKKRIDNKSSLDEVMYHEFSHILFRIGIFKPQFFLWSKEEKQCDNIAKVRLNSRIKVIV